MSLVESSPKGKLHKIACPRCSNASRKTEAQLRDHGPDYCRPCTDLQGVPVKMKCEHLAVHAITPEGRAEALAEEIEIAGRRLERRERKVYAQAYQQLCCEKCKHPLAKALSIKLINGWQQATGQGYDGGLLWLTATGLATSEADSIVCGREGCTHDRFVPKRVRGKAQKPEVMPF